MGDDDIIVGQVKPEDLEGGNTQAIKDFINSIEAGDFTTAETSFMDQMQQRQNDVLDQMKIAVANKTYNGMEDEVEDEVTSEEEETEEETS